MKNCSGGIVAAPDDVAMNVGNLDDYLFDEYRDVHELSDFDNENKNVVMEVDLQTDVTYCALDKNISERILTISKKRGVSSETLINMWLQEKLREEQA